MKFSFLCIFKIFLFYWNFFSQNLDDKNVFLHRLKFLNFLMFNKNFNFLSTPSTFAAFKQIQPPSCAVLGTCFNQLCYFSGWWKFVDPWTCATVCWWHSRDSKLKPQVSFAQQNNWGTPGKQTEHLKTNSFFCVCNLPLLGHKPASTILEVAYC